VIPFFFRTEHGNHLFCYLSPVQKHLEYLVPEDGLQLFEFQWRGDAKHAFVSVKAAVGYENVAVRIESKAPMNGIVRLRIFF